MTPNSNSCGQLPIPWRAKFTSKHQLFRTHIPIFGLGSREDGFEYPKTLTSLNYGTGLSFGWAIRDSSTTFHFRETRAKNSGFFGTEKKNGKVLALASSSELKSSSIARRLNRAEDSTRLLKVCISIVLKLMRQTCMGTDGWFPGCDRIGENGFNKKLSNCFSNTSTDFSQTKNIRL